jgi:heat shock protein HslJ
MAAAQLIALLALVTPALLAAADPAPDPAASWLDAGRPTPWNRPGAAVPSAPAAEVDAALRARCRDAERPADQASRADRAVVAAGWRLLGPLQRFGATELVEGHAGVDGMCRPLASQGFVFVEGRFAGTIAPAPMDSRAEGSAREVRLVGAGAVAASFARYAPSDPLCCPSRTSAVTYTVERGASGPRLVAAPAATAPVAWPAAPPRPGPAAGAVPPAPAELQGRTWELVRIRFGDDSVLTPPEPSRYTLRLDPAGRAEVGADCNRAGGSYTLDGPRLGFGPLASTRAACPPGSLSDKYLQQLGLVRSWLVRDGRLHLATLADGAILEFC